MSQENMIFNEVFLTANIAMRITGCHPGRPRDKLWRTQLIFLVTFMLFSIVLLCFSIFFRDIPQGRYTDASKNIAMLIVTLTTLFKYTILVVHQKTVMGIINIINEDYEFDEISDTEKEIVLEYSKEGKRACKLWLVSTIISGTIFPFKAILMMLYIFFKQGEFQLVPVFDISYPEAIDVIKNDPPLYFILLAYCMLFGLYAATAYIGFDPLIPIFLTHACGQLEVYSQRILTLFSKDASEEELQEKLKNIIIKLQKIYAFVDTVKKDFTLLLEFTMKTTTFLLPLCAFQIRVSLRNRDSNLEFVPFFLATLMLFYMPCYYSDLLMEKSERLRLAIYSSGWELQYNPRIRKTVLIMLTRATRPLVIQTVFYPVCLDTFAEMARTAYAIFNIMTASLN